MKWLLLVVAVALLSVAKGDTPADCRFEDVVGEWNFDLKITNAKDALDCSNFKPNSQYKIKMIFPNIAVDQFGNKGTWTMIYNQGFEVTVAGRKYFAFSKFKQSGKVVTSYCGLTGTGWTHNIVGTNWGCYSATKTTPVPPRNHTMHPEAPKHLLLSAGFASQQTMSLGSLERMFSMAGGRGSTLRWRPSAVEASPEVKAAAVALPEAWDWRNVAGVNYVSPVRDQGACGSCYAFASMAMLESRIRILTNNGNKVVLSPQDVVECSAYSQGCNGGFPYLIGGKYAQDFGVVPEKCNPYTGYDGQCSTNCTDIPRGFTSDYKYVGGYYGACSEEAMMVALVRNGPVAVGFQVNPDFFQYKNGVFKCEKKLEPSPLPPPLRKFYPFEETNHAVLVVGYGVDKASGDKFWIVKNSWGEGWGLDGYFMMRRGQDDCGIESMAVEATPIL